MIRFPCPQCGGLLEAFEYDRGGEANCLGCGSIVQIPYPQDGFFRFPCPTCGKRLKAKPEHSGKKTHCIKCGTRFVVPSTAVAVATTAPDRTLHVNTNPKYCSNCGQPLQSGARFCCGCGAPTTGAISPTSRAGRADITANRKMLAQLRDDAADLQVLVPEMIRVAVRLNPVNVQIYNFLSFINQVTENSQRHEVAQLVQAAMQSVDLTNAVSMLDNALDQVTFIGPEMVKSYSSALLTVWPESRHLVRHHWLDDPAKEGENIRQQLLRAVRTHRQDLSVIQSHFRQLSEFHPRYHSIMTRTGLWDYVLGFAAGFLGGDLGVIGAQVWDNWRSKSDTEFVQSFGNAVSQFSTATLAFTQKTEQEVESILVGFLKDYHDFAQGIIAALEGIIETTDISKIYHKLHDPDPAERPDEGSKEFFEAVLSNLRDQKVSARSEANLREMIGIR